MDEIIRREREREVVRCTQPKDDYEPSWRCPRPCGPFFSPLASYYRVSISSCARHRTCCREKSARGNEALWPRRGGGQKIASISLGIFNRRNWRTATDYRPINSNYCAFLLGRLFCRQIDLCLTFIRWLDSISLRVFFFQEEEWRSHDWGLFVVDTVVIWSVLAIAYILLGTFRVARISSGKKSSFFTRYTSYIHINLKNYFQNILTTFFHVAWIVFTNFGGNTIISFQYRNSMLNLRHNRFGSMCATV